MVTSSQSFGKARRLHLLGSPTDAVSTDNLLPLIQRRTHHVPGAGESTHLASNWTHSPTQFHGKTSILNIHKGKRFDSYWVIMRLFLWRRTVWYGQQRFGERTGDIFLRTGHTIWQLEPPTHLFLLNTPGTACWSSTSGPTPVPSSDTQGSTNSYSSLLRHSTVSSERWY